ncbi:MAG: GNAT family N-acetyltransferase [Bryobacteraceae bacterium]
MSAQILDADTPSTIDQVRALFQEYWASFGFTPCFQGFQSELDALPGAYAAPLGRLLLATIDGEAAGCIALRPVDETRCEAKRLYVRPKFRGSGLGRALLERIIEEARAAGYKELIGDTLPVMDRALVLYDRIGFERVAARSGGAEDTIYIRMPL